MDYVRSNKGGMKLLFQSNLYVKQKVLSSGAVCWENMWSTTLRIHTLEDFVLVDIAEQPLFDLALWNMYDQTIGDLLRTNNAVEGWHRRFQANVGAYRPNFWKFIDILKREQSLNHVNISQARAGHQPEPHVVAIKTATDE